MIRKEILLIMGKNLNDPLDFGCQNWIDSLTEDDYRVMRKEATLNVSYCGKLDFGMHSEKKMY